MLNYLLRHVTVLLGLTDGLAGTLAQDIFSVPVSSCPLSASVCCSLVLSPRHVPCRAVL